MYYLLICKSFKELLLLHSLVFSERGCKDKNFYFILPNVFGSFSKSFFHHVLQCRSLSNADAKVVLYNIHSKLYSHYFLLKIAPNTLLFWSTDDYGVKKNNKYPNEGLSFKFSRYHLSNTLKSTFPYTLLYEKSQQIQQSPSLFCFY